MVVVCIVSGCKSSYKVKYRPDGRKIRFFQFPPKDNWRYKYWTHNVGLEPTPFQRICCLHFKEEDIVKERSDSNKNRNKSRKELRLLRLTPNAVPVLNMGVPRSSLKFTPKKRTDSTTMEARRQNAVALAKLELQKQILADLLKGVEDLIERLEKKGMPDNWITMQSADGTLFLNLMEICNSTIPNIVTSIAIKPNLTLFLSYRGKPLNHRYFSNIFSTGDAVLTKFSQVLKLMMAIDTWSVQVKENQWLEMAENCLSNYLAEEVNKDRTLEKKVSFLSEQLELARKAPSGRRFSRDMTLFAYTLYTTNAQVYLQMKAADVVSLPSRVSLLKLIRAEGIQGLDEACRRAKVGEADDVQEEYLSAEPALLEDVDSLE